MRWLLFLSKLAFICGLFFIVSVTLLIKKWVSDPVLESTIITIGYLMGMIIFPATVIIYLVMIIAKKKLTEYVPLWLIFANILFLLLLIYFIFYLNDPYYHQQ
jgi:uncharacterized BrkB/YihY/UPF0761 family membrane protein